MPGMVGLSAFCVWYGQFGGDWMIVSGNNSLKAACSLPVTLLVRKLLHPKQPFLPKVKG